MKSAQYHEIVRAAKSYKKFKISRCRNSGGSYEDKLALVKAYSEGLGNYFYKGRNVIGYIDITFREGRFQQLEGILGLK